MAYFQPLALANLDHLLPEPRRSLRPQQKTRAATTMQVQRCEVLVQVVGARNVPIREESTDPSRPPGSPKKRRPGAGDAGYGGSSSGGGGGYGSGSGGRGGESGGRAGGRRGDGAVAEEFLDESKLEFQRRARTFVEVRFQEHSRRTGVNAGRSPLWKESLSIPFRPPGNDFSPANLAQVRENIYFSLFDECMDDDSARGGLYEGEDPLRYERRFLGSFVLPFGTLWASAGGRVEGVFRLDLPCLNFGYTPPPPLQTATAGMSMFRDASEGLGAQQGAADVIDPFHQQSFLEMIILKLGFARLVKSWGHRRPQQNDLCDYASHMRPAIEREFEFFVGAATTTYVKLMITLDPVLIAPPRVPQEVAVGAMNPDDRPFASAAKAWLRAAHGVSKYTKERPYRLFGCSTRGLNTLICRFLVPMRPPQGFETRRACVHLLTLLPFMTDSQAFGRGDMWCTAKEAWDTGAGDEEEHAVILFNYLYYLYHADGGGQKPNAGGAEGVRQSRKQHRQGGATAYPTEAAIADEGVFLVQGRSVPEGDSVYVLIRDKAANANDPPSASNFLLINPCTGQVFPAADPRCPMIDLACLATPYNMWANVQVGGQPCELRYDLSNPDHWRPFFGARLPPPPSGLQSIQEDVSYEPTSSGYALDIETATKNAIGTSTRLSLIPSHCPLTSIPPLTLL